MSAHVLLCETRKALRELHEHLEETQGDAYAAEFCAAYRERIKYPATAALPVLVAHIAGCLEALAVTLDLPNDADGSAEDDLLMLM